MRLRCVALAGAALAPLVTAAIFYLAFPTWVYRWTGSQYQFNRAVSRSVPRGASLTELESVVGPATRTPGPGWLRQQYLRDPGRFPDGWKEGDDFAMYRFPGNATWYFQVRERRLVNYDPAVLAGQPQDNLAAVR